MDPESAPLEWRIKRLEQEIKANRELIEELIGDEAKTREKHLKQFDLDMEDVQQVG